MINGVWYDKLQQNREISRRPYSVALAYAVWYDTLFNVMFYVWLVGVELTIKMDVTDNYETCRDFGCFIQIRDHS